MKDQDDHVIGHLQAFPQSSVHAELRRWDPAMRNDPERTYVIHILPERRQAHGSLLWIDKLCEEVEQRGFNKYSMHIRTTNGLSDWIQKCFPQIRACGG